MTLSLHLSIIYAQCTTLFVDADGHVPGVCCARNPAMHSGAPLPARASAPKAAANVADTTGEVTTHTKIAESAWTAKIDKTSGRTYRLQFHSYS